MKKLKLYEEFTVQPNSNDNTHVNHDNLGIINIQITGEGFIKNAILNDIKNIINKYQGETHLFVDGNEINSNE